MINFDIFDIFDIFKHQDMLGGGGGATATNCMLLTQHPTNPNVIGYSSDFLNGGAEEYGNMIPNTTSDGTLIYSYEIDHSSGLFVLKFGEDSVTKIPNVNDAVLYHNADGTEGNMLFVWDDINKWYSATDLEKATAMKAYIDTVICLEAYAIPIILVLYDFSTVEVEGYAPPPPPLLPPRIRYTSTDDLTLLTPYSVGGTAYITDNGDGTYDLWSDDNCEFIALSDDYYDWYNSDLNITKIEIISGGSLKYFVRNDTSNSTYTFAMMKFVTEFIWNGDSSPIYTDDMFAYCERIMSIDLTNFDTSNVTDMSYMFTSCYLLKSIDLTSFDTSNVIYMINMFNTSDSLECITNLNTTNVVEKDGMFEYCPLLVQPDATAQTDLTDVDGADWVNPGSCP